MIYCFSRPNQMTGHRFTDDVAIVKAINKKSAIKKFNKYYETVSEHEVYKVSVGYNKIQILTDY